MNFPAVSEWPINGPLGSSGMIDWFTYSSFVDILAFQSFRFILEVIKNE